MWSDEGELPRRGYLGFDVRAERRSPTPARERFIVSRIEPGGPGASAGLELGDDLWAVNSFPVESLQELRASAAGLRPGSAATVSVERGGALLTLPIVPVPMPREVVPGGQVVLRTVPWHYQGANYRLRAVWTVPEGAIRAALWLLPSATWMSLEMPLDPLDPTFQFLAALTAQGVATVRVDRSGLGDSEGPPTTELDLEAELSMWEAARQSYLNMGLLRGVPKSVFGRSLGGMLAPLVAADAAFESVIVWGTSSDPWHEASLRSSRRQFEQKGISRAELARLMEAERRMGEAVYLRGLSPAEARSLDPSLDGMSREVFAGTTVHDRYHIFFSQLQSADVAGAWARVRGRVLAVAPEFDILTERTDHERIVSLVGERARLADVLGVDHFMHRRASMEDAVRAPWGGSYAPESSALVGQFLLESG
jgi:uncharacterized protein